MKLPYPAAPEAIAVNIPVSPLASSFKDGGEGLTSAYEGISGFQLEKSSLFEESNESIFE